MFIIELGSNTNTALQFIIMCLTLEFLCSFGPLVFPARDIVVSIWIVSRKLHFMISFFPIRRPFAFIEWMIFRPITQECAKFTNLSFQTIVIPNQEFQPNIFSMMAAQNRNSQLFFPFHFVPIVFKCRSPFTSGLELKFILENRFMFPALSETNEWTTRPTTNPTMASRS